MLSAIKGLSKKVDLDELKEKAKQKAEQVKESAAKAAEEMKRRKEEEERRRREQEQELVSKVEGARDGKDALLEIGLHEKKLHVIREFLRSSGKYEKPFLEGKFAAFSILGTESWSDYAEDVLLAIVAHSTARTEQLLEEQNQLLARIADALERLAGGETGETQIASH